jgi:hypothetical protein
MSDRTNIQLLRTDYTDVLQSACEAFLGAADAGRDAIAEWPKDVERLDRALVRMTTMMLRATRLIIPAPDAMEYFGLPRSVTASGAMPEPAVRVQDPARETWDFRPWLSEKLSHLRDNLYALLETTETLRELSQSDARNTASDADDGSVLENVLERSRYEIRATRAYAVEVLNAINEMGLTVVDWRVGESE